MLENYIIENIENNQYALKKLSDNNIYFLNATILKFDKVLKRGDMIAIHNQLFDVNYDEYSNHYYFGPINEMFGREIKSPEDVDYVSVNIDGVKYDLKRFYG